MGQGVLKRITVLEDCLNRWRDFSSQESERSRVGAGAMQTSPHSSLYPCPDLQHPSQGLHCAKSANYAKSNRLFSDMN